MASNMDTVGTMAMARACGPEMMTCLHKYYSDSQLVEFFSSDPVRASVFFTVGIKDDDFEKLARIRKKADIVLSVSMPRTATRSSSWIESNGFATRSPA